MLNNPNLPSRSHDLVVLVRTGHVVILAATDGQVRGLAPIPIDLPGFEAVVGRTLSALVHADRPRRVLVFAAGSANAPPLSAVTAVVDPLRAEFGFEVTWLPDLARLVHAAKSTLPCPPVHSSPPCL